MTDSYWTKTTRLMLASVKEVGAMPFILFEYYLTWQTAPEGIKPSLQRIADDLGMEKNAVCNLRSRLIKAGWIRYENDEVFIEKSFTKNESLSQKMNTDSQKMNKSFTKNESLYKEEKEQTERTNEKERAPAPEQIQSSVHNIRAVEDLQIERTDDLKNCEALKLFESSFKITAGNHTAEAISVRIKNLDVWRTLIRDKIAFADKSLAQRQGIANWIFTAYEERLAKFNGAKNGNTNGNGTNIGRANPKSSSEYLASLNIQSG